MKESISNTMEINEPKVSWKIYEDNTVQKVLFVDNDKKENNRELKNNRSSTFIDNLSIPIHRWFRYSAGFSAEWVRNLLIQEYEKGKRNVLDPFAGSGTVLLEAEYCNYNSIGLDSHPFISKIAKSKLLWRSDFKYLARIGLDVIERSKKINTPVQNPPKLIKQCFYKGHYEKLNSIFIAIESINTNENTREILWLAAISIIRECSSAGTAQWQYVLPEKEKKNVSEPYQAFYKKIMMMAGDMKERQKWNIGPEPKYFKDDARKMSSVEDSWADLVVTSPPYVNNYDYADAVRLELTVLGKIERWRDLHDEIRKYLLPSCTQHVTRVKSQTMEIANDPILDPIKKELIPAVEKLEKLRSERKGKKVYDTLAASYFRDMAIVWKQLRVKTNDGAKVCFVIGDSAPYGVYLPVDKWFGDLALAYGFKSYKFEKTRDRNIKWKNRKHRVPLKEGRLWVEG